MLNMDKMTVRDIDVNGKRVLVRVDFNVPVDVKTGIITDDGRIRAALPTVKYLIENKAKIILMSHFGRPKGKVVEAMRLAPTARRLSEFLVQPVEALKDCVGPEVLKAASDLRAGEVMLLENLRFHPEEEAGDVTFAKTLASLGDIFVNDAFGTAHRAHASVSVVAQFLPAVAGFLMEKEIDTLGGLLQNPDHPFTGMFGGAKVSDKVKVLKNIMGKIDCLLIGGGMAATFLKAKGYAVGASDVETENIDVANDIMKHARMGGVKLCLPEDALVAEKIDNRAIANLVSVDNIPVDKKILDIGPKTSETFRKELERSRTVFWNGPMGVTEIPQFAKGTETLAKTLPRLKAKTIIGGGSTAEVIDTLGLNEKVTFVSTGGGASLEFLGGEKLPGVVALMDKPSGEEK
jgi:phosphoglycerate kinase